MLVGSIMHLPPELHDEILLHLDRQDIASYRLVCRNFAIAGTAPLFSRLHFRTSVESLHRLSQFSKLKSGRHVKHLLWNTTGSEFEARAFLEGFRMREMKYILGRASPSLPTRTVTLPEPCPPSPPYSSSEIEEDGKVELQLSCSLGVFLLTTIFSGFPNLKSLYILTSRTSPSAFTQDGWATRSLTSAPDPWPSEWKVTHGCPRCCGLCQAIQSNGRYEMQVAALAAYSAGCPLTQLRVEHLKFLDSNSGAVVQGYETALGNVEELDLVFGMRTRSVVHIQQIFKATPKLKVLKLWLNSASWWADTDHTAPLPNLKDIFPSPEAFPALRQLELHQLDVAEDFLEAFLLSHARTLMVLKLHRMRLNAGGLWVSLLKRLHGRLRALEEVWLDGEFEDGVSYIDGTGWDMDSSLGRIWEAQLLGREEGVKDG
ncbi:uncharacterized protein N0V89_003777 [Didymosphaeria variabile]|uniref:F-box domain-containing protein n=1 Tax=Didymosphaeria variabile TaxID=1932322 RepID=A0A9W8XPC9_9PLEO|nr:uncharacterized protein N0V89_003777 [Didymosphaeria variabile]KAJ4355757.1 hypothetical protein N0V89_003777 [Didymosphaeria variabile]